MDDLIKKLNKLFDEIINEKDYDKFFSALTRYFNFIKDNYPLDQITSTIFSASSSGILIKSIGKLYYTIINHQPLDVSVAINPFFLEGSGLRSFHNKLVENFNKTKVSEKKSKKEVFERDVIFHKEEDNNSVFLRENPSKRYLMKGKKPQRFEILIALLNSKNGMSASSLAKKLNKKDDGKITQDILKREIEKINKNFIDECEGSKVLISKGKSKTKNIYYLNKKEYDFLFDNE